MADKEERILDLTEKYITIRDQRDMLLEEVEMLKREKLHISEDLSSRYEEIDSMRNRYNVLQDNLRAVLQIVGELLKFTHVAPGAQNVADTIMEQLKDAHKRLWEQYFG